MSLVRPTVRELIHARARLLARVQPRAGTDDPATLLRDPGVTLAPTRRKKTRGWRRRMRELDKWFVEQADHEPAEHMAAAARIRFDMWGWPMPLRVRRRMVEGLVWVHDQWQPKMEALHAKTGLPTYLGIWLTGALYDSGTWASIDDDAVWHRTRHEVPQPSGMAERVGPPAEYHTRNCDLSRFEWTHWVSTWNELLSDFPTHLWPGMIRGAYRIEPVESSDGPDLRVHWTTHDYYGWIRPVSERGARGDCRWSVIDASGNPE